ncbi:uncharacterized protein LOC108664510 [Hyalella azteca]|uniref:Uncharacterized protein LOC108664510 n=1 Tax=Hyalella azteca TaxID=294128 RepID=A0A8B7MZA2_HYAAZ|nr:uncharacterized protein LOC108664510 [Hyalella azteca]
MLLLVAVLLLAGSAAAESPGPSNLLGCNNGWKASAWMAGTGNLNTVASTGLYNIVYRDGKAAESAFSCPQLSLNAAGGTYTYNYKNSAGALVSQTGNLTWTADPGYFDLQGMKTGHLGTDCGWFQSTCTARLYPFDAAPNGLLLKACTGWFIFAAQTAYYLVPSSTASTNNPCNNC